MNKPAYLGLSMLELSKISMYQFWYDYEKAEYGKNAQLCYMDAESFIVYIKTGDKNRFKNILQKILKLDLALQIMN